MTPVFFKLLSRLCWLVACGCILLASSGRAGSLNIPQGRTDDSSRFAGLLHRAFATTSLSNQHQKLLSDAYVSFLELNTSVGEGNPQREPSGVASSTDPRVVFEKTAFARPELETAVYDYVLLANGVKILLISKKEEAFNGIYVTINTGFSDDPQKLEGLAHFHEHLLTCGSLFEPKTDSNRQYISSMLGHCDAMTQNNVTQLRVSFMPLGTRGMIKRLRYLLTNATFPTSVFQQELNAIDNEFLFRKQEYEQLLVVQDAIMNPNHPLASQGVGADTLKARVKEKGVDHMRAQLMVFNALNCIGPRIQVFAVTGEPIETYRQDFIDNFSAIPSEAITDLNGFKEKINVMGLNPQEVEMALKEQLESRQLHQDSMASSVLSPAQYGVTIYQEDKDSVQYSASYLFPVETEWTNDVNIAGFFHALRGVDLPWFHGTSGPAQITTLMNLGERPRLVYAIGFLVGFGDEEPLEDRRIGTVLREIFEFLDVIFRAPAAKLEKLCQFANNQKVPRDVNPFSLMKVLNLDSGDPQVALNETLDGRSWNYTRLIDEKTRFLVPKNVVVQVIGPRLKSIVNGTWGTRKVVTGWNINYWIRPLDLDLLRDCSIVAQRNVKEIGGQSRFVFPRLKRQELNATVHKREEDALKLGSGAPPVEVYFHGVSPSDAVALRKEAESLGITLQANTTKAVPRYFEIVTENGGVVRVAHEHTPDLQSPDGYVTLSLESPLIEISVSSEVMIHIFVMTLRRRLMGDTGPSVAGDIMLKDSRPMSMHFLLQGNSFEVEKRFIKVLDYIQKIVEDRDSFLLMEREYSISSNILAEAWVETHRDAEAFMRSYHEALLTPFNVPLHKFFGVLYEIPPEEIGRRVLGALRLVLQNCNPSLVVVGNFRRQEAEKLAHAVGKALRFVNSDVETYDVYRAVQLPLAPNRVEVVPENNEFTDYSGLMVTFQVPYDVEMDQEKAISFGILTEHLNRAVVHFYRYQKGMCYTPKVKLEEVYSRGLYAPLTLSIVSRTHKARELLAVLSEWKQAARTYIEQLPLEDLSLTLRNWGYAEAVVRPKSMYFVMRSRIFLDSSTNLFTSIKMGLYLIRMSQQPEEYKRHLLDLFDTYIADGGPALRELRILLQRSGEASSQITSEPDVAIPKWDNHTITCSLIEDCRVVMSQLSVFPVRREVCVKNTMAEYQTALKVVVV